MDGPSREELLRDVALYREANDAYQKRDLPKARELLEKLLASEKGVSLHALLLKAYIERAEKKPLSEMRTLEELLRIFDTQLASGKAQSQLAAAWSLLGAACSALGESALAETAFLHSVEREPDRNQRLVEYSNAIFSANHNPRRTAEDMRRLYRGYRALLADAAPYGKRFGRHEKLRIGYLSGDFRRHPVAYFVFAPLRFFDQAHFEVYGYAVHQKSDDLTETLRRLPTVWRVFPSEDWAEIAAAIHEDEIDILVDLSGHTSTSCLPVLAYQPAPIQMSGIGYMNSTGLENVDYFLSDAYCSPRKMSAYFTERMLRLPETHLCYTRPGVFPEVMRPPCLEKGYVTFGCFNNFSKVTPEVLRLWAQIMDAVPTTRLVLKHKLFDAEEGRVWGRSRLQDAGIDDARVELRGFSRDYLSDYHDVDIALDSSPYTGGLTTCEALYMGVPVVTLAGTRHGSRFGVSLLTNVGLPELAAPSEAEYIGIAAALAEDTALLSELRGRLRPMMAASPLMDGPGYVRELEKAFFRIYCEIRR